MGRTAYFIKVRFDAALRSLAVFRRMPWILWLPLLAVVGGAVAGLYLLAASPKLFPLFIALPAAALLFFHSSRRDSRLVAVAGYNPRRVFMSEYSIFITPFFLIGCLAGRFPEAYMLWVLPLVALLPAGRPTVNRTVFPWLGTVFSTYEYTTGVRTGWYWFLPFLLLAGSLCALPYASFVILILFLLLSSEFHTVHEPLSFLVLPGKLAGRYMLSKIAGSFRDHAVLTVVPVVLSVAFNPLTWWLGVAYYIFSATALAYYVFMKYADYTPASREAAAGTGGSVGMLGIVLPFL